MSASIWRHCQLQLQTKISLSRVRSLQMGKIFKGKPKRAPATAVTVHVLCLDTSMSFAHASQIHAVRECTRGRSVLLLCS